MNVYSQDLEVKIIDSKKNRSLISKKNFAKDDVILMEKPFVCAQFAWNQFYQYKACDYCMKPLETAQENVCRLAEDSSLKLPYLKECCTTNKASHCVCDKCGLEYCSEECRVAAFNTYHESLCQLRSDPNSTYNVLMDIWRQIHLPPETTSLELVIKMIATMKQASNKTEFMKKLANFECQLVNENENEQIPHKLLSERFYGELENLRAMTFDLFSNHLYVKECEQWLTSEGFRQMFSLIGRNSQGIGTSPFSVWVENSSNLETISKGEKKKLDKLIDKIYEKLEKASESFLNSEGSGLYELQSMINHSCKPNAEIKFKNNNNVLSIVALEEIKPNQEILISYLDECELSRSRHSRQKELRENYLFKCECERCIAESDQPDETSDEELEEDEEDEDDDDEDSEMEN